ncbi:MAG: chemotaxis-specific protein-glutamate methyltransferase CheB [Spirochaetales bacterium]
MAKTSVMIVDDSALMRNLISRIFQQADDLEVCGTAMNGRFALEKLHRLQPDVIVLDLEMPDVNGIDFLTECRKRGVKVPVIILSSHAQRGARITMDALSLGAEDFILKPTGRGGPDVQSVAEQLVGMARAYGNDYRERRERGEVSDIPAPARSGRDGREKPEAPPREEQRDAGQREREEAARKEATSTGGPEIVAPKLRTTTGEPARGLPARTPKRKPGRLKAIAIGVSTGGPNALRRMLPALSSDVGVPILVVQHMPAGFTKEFARSLDRLCTQEVREAAEGDVLAPGRIFIAPGDRHMRVERRSLATVIRIGEDGLISGHRPSADALFASVAAAFGHECLAVIMTGMGRDGAREIGTIYEAGGMTAGQDQKSSVVYGMPRAAWEAGYLHEQVSLDDMADFINATALELQESS